MQINGKVHCFFEQSGTFKNEFRKLGYEAFDYDIQNNFGETNFVIDLFAEIEKAYRGGGRSVFDNITSDDLIVAFFPCIYFCEKSMWHFQFSCNNYRKLNNEQKVKKIIEREDSRHSFYKILLEFVGVIEKKKLRMIFENPYTQPHFLTNNFVIPPTIIDKDRSRRGDFRRKPTQYFFFNCEPTNGFTHQQTPGSKILTHDDLRGGIHAGICSEERSMISSDYARNWICDFVLGKRQKEYEEPSLFDFDELGA